MEEEHKNGKADTPDEGTQGLLGGLGSGVRDRLRSHTRIYLESYSPATDG